MSNIKRISIKKIKDEKLYNLAVEVDESYVANDIVVHNCRSLLNPIFVGEKEEQGSFYYNYEDRYEPFGTGVSKDATKPSKGFGG